jgi:hypothetical protein
VNIKIRRTLKNDATALGETHVCRNPCVADT